MIIWQGYGIIVPVLFLVGTMGSHILANKIAGGQASPFMSQCFVSVGTALAAAICWFLGKKLNGEKPRFYTDKETGEEVVIKKSHTFFFIKLEYWGVLFGVLAIYAFYAGFKQ